MKSTSNREKHFRDAFFLKPKERLTCRTQTSHDAPRTRASRSGNKNFFPTLINVNSQQFRRRVSIRCYKRAEEGWQFRETRVSVVEGRSKEQGLGVLGDVCMEMFSTSGGWKLFTRTSERLPRKRDLGNIGKISWNVRQEFHRSLCSAFSSCRTKAGESLSGIDARDLLRELRWAWRRFENVSTRVGCFMEGFKVKLLFCPSTELRDMIDQWLDCSYENCDSEWCVSSIITGNRNWICDAWIREFIHEDVWEFERVSPVSHCLIRFHLGDNSITETPTAISTMISFTDFKINFLN